MRPFIFLVFLVLFARLSKKINKKVMSMFEKAEQEYQDLKQRKSIIENDKDKIEKVITELDAKKNETLKKTWVKVNRDFGSIFSTLLPGANAKLEPEEGKSVSMHAHIRLSNVRLLGLASTTVLLAPCAIIIVFCDC